MDLNAIKNRLESLNQDNKPKSREKKDYTLVYWKPKQEGKYQIRFVPSKLNKENPFQEVFMHYGIGKFPIVLVGHSYWDGMIKWIKATMLELEKNISASDLDLFSVVDTPEEAVEVIEQFYKLYNLKPNF